MATTKLKNLAVDMKFEIVVIPCLGCRPREGVLREARVAARRRLCPR